MIRISPRFHPFDLSATKKRQQGKLQGQLRYRAAADQAVAPYPLGPDQLDEEIIRIGTTRLLIRRPCVPCRPSNASTTAVRLLPGALATVESIHWRIKIGGSRSPDGPSFG
jgi:hypothetical protein